MTALFIMMLLVLVALLAWVVKLLLGMPKEEGAGAKKKFSGSAFGKALRETSADQEEMQDMGERLLRRLDKKIDVLKELLKEADEKIDTLRKGGYVLPAEYPHEVEREIKNSRTRNVKDKEKEKEGGDRRTRIVALRRKGVAPDQIAREVGMGQGEVELILRVEGY